MSHILSMLVCVSSKSAFEWYSVFQLIGNGITIKGKNMLPKSLIITLNYEGHHIELPPK